MTVNTESLVNSIERFLDELERGDVEAAIGAVESLVHPEMEFTSMIGSEVDGRTYIGINGLREWFQDFSDSFEIRYVDRSFRALGDDVVVGLFTNELRGRSSQVEIARAIGTVWELENDLIVKAVTYTSQDQALEAAEAAHA